MGHNPQDPAIDRNYIGLTSYDLRHRVNYDSAGRGVHNGQHNEHFNSTFASTCDNWINNLNSFSTTYIGSGYSVDWVGDVGVGVNKSGYHGSARAFDLTQIRFANNNYCDMNWSWRQNILHMRRYLAVAAQCRRYFGNVLTCWYNAAHGDHIHFDNGVAATSIRTTAHSDATLVQAACNLLNDESLAIDGAWGSGTEAAYQRLIGKFRMTCYNPKTSTSHAMVFLAHIVKHGFANVAAGAYTSSC